MDEIFRITQFNGKIKRIFFLTINNLLISKIVDKFAAIVDIKLQKTPVDKVLFRGRCFYIKRDDLLHEAFSGNKARKFYYFLKNDFPSVNKLIAHGSAQANSLYSLSALAKLKGWQFDYYVDHIAPWLKQNPAGNYRAALQNGANILSVQDMTSGLSVIDTIEQVVLPAESAALFVPEGGRCEHAELGVKELANEIIAWAEQQALSDLKVVLPSGTGTTALFLQKNLPFEVLSCACVGGDQYLKKQFYQLSSDVRHHPCILSTKRKYHFGKLYDEFYRVWCELKEATAIEFDLLYDPLGWLTLMAFLSDMDKLSADTFPAILYIHQGGLLGNETMLPRYQRSAFLK